MPPAQGARQGKGSWDRGGGTGMQFGCRCITCAFSFLYTIRIKTIIETNTDRAIRSRTCRPTGRPSGNGSSPRAAW